MCMPQEWKKHDKDNEKVAKVDTSTALVAKRLGVLVLALIGCMLLSVSNLTSSNPQADWALTLRDAFADGSQIASFCTL